jgi:putative FmdB family regulatory protein
VPTFTFRCDCGARFETFQRSWRDAHPDCPACGRATSRLPGRVALLGGARPPMGDAQAPTSFEGAHRGDREFVAHWQRTLEKRRAFEEKHPEHHVRREAVAAHEGAFERAPLTYKELAERSAPTGDATVGAAAASADRGVVAVPRSET